MLLLPAFVHCSTTLASHSCTLYLYSTFY